MLETLKPERGLSGGGGGYGVPGKYKPRRLSAQRDFPRDCGRFAIRSNANQRDKNPVDLDSPIVKPDVVKTLVSSSDSQKLELNTNLDAKETIILPEVLECEIRKPEKDLDEGEVLTAKESVEPLVIVTDLSNQMEEAEFVKDSEKSSQIGDNEQQCSTMDAIMTDVETPLNVSDEPETSLHNIGSMRVMYPPRRKTSAVRDFPPNCGRNALAINQKEPMKLAAQLENQNIETSGGNLPPEKIVRDRKVRDIVKDEEDHRRKLKKSVMKDFVDNVRVKSERDIMKVTRENVQVQLVRQSKLEKDEEINVMSPAVSDLPQPNMKSLSLSKAVGRDIANLGGKLEKESFKINKDNNFKRNVSEVVQGEDSSSVFSNDREIVMALMAAQNCSWTQLQTKHGFKSTDHGTTKEKVSKHESIVHARQKKGADSSEEKSTKRNDSCEISNYMVAEDEENSLEYNGESENLSLALKPQDHTMSLIPFGLHSLLHEDDNNGGAATRNQVRETLRLFQAIFRKLLRDEEAKSKEKGISCGRIDLNSAKILKEKRKWVNTGKSIVGIVPGVEVGDEFHWRVELAIIGLHRPYIGGIDYVKNGKGRVLATSIVASGCYAGDMDSSDILIYSGQGGNRVSGEKAEDQKLERGNLGLKNSMDDNSPVRVIRGFKETKASDSVDTRGKMVATYIYDGLYMVERYWQEKGRYGNNVFMFRLSRIPGQPELAWKEVKKSKKLRVREGLCVDDITQGKEKMPICAVNTIDNEKPPPFKYITSMIYPSCYELTTPNGCECVDGCSDTEKCICAVRNGGEIPFNYNGAIVEAKPLVYECGPFCKCPPSCHNRVSQKGIKFQLEIFKTESRGWGVRSLTSIPSGSFICEYTGELLEDKEAEQRTGNDEYLFDIGSNYNDQTLWDGLSNLVPPELQPCYSYETVEDVGFTIDAAEYGSVGRFINHSCSPNLYAQNVLYDHGDKRMPHIMLFAAENIPPLQELTYHYNYVVDQVRDSSGNIKKKNCYCGSSECTGRLY